MYFLSISLRDSPFRGVIANHVLIEQVHCIYTSFHQSMESLKTVVLGFR